MLAPWPNYYSLCTRLSILCWSDDSSRILTLASKLLWQKRRSAENLEHDDADDDYEDNDTLTFTLLRINDLTNILVVLIEILIYFA